MLKVQPPFVKIRDLGRGRYGVVSLVRQKHGSNKQFVLKEVDLNHSRPKERRAAELEVKLLSTLRHPNIVRYYSSYDTPDDRLHIILEFCEGGDLWSLVHQRANTVPGQLFDENQVLDWFVQITMALEYLHDRNILHRDLKSKNIFLTRRGVVKVGDFGIAKVLESASDMAETVIGTPYYLSPEVFQNIPYNHKSDIWALGCCLYELCTLQHAFEGKDFSSICYKVMQGRVPAVSTEYGPDLRKLIRAMLQLKPEKRPSTAKILRHQYIRQHIVRFLQFSFHNNNNDNSGSGGGESNNVENQKPEKPVVSRSEKPVQKRRRFSSIHGSCAISRATSESNQLSQSLTVDPNSPITPDQPNSHVPRLPLIGDAHSNRDLVKSNDIDSVARSKRRKSRLDEIIKLKAGAETNFEVRARTLSAPSAKTMERVLDQRRIVSAIVPHDQMLPLGHKAEAYVYREDSVNDLLHVLNATLQLTDAHEHQSTNH